MVAAVPVDARGARSGRLWRMTKERAEQEAEARFPGYGAEANVVGDRYRIVLVPLTRGRLPGVSSAEFGATDESLVGEGESFEEALENLSA
jgi:hypothetical protein